MPVGGREDDEEDGDEDGDEDDEDDGGKGGRCRRRFSTLRMMSSTATTTTTSRTRGTSRTITHGWSTTFLNMHPTLGAGADGRGLLEEITTSRWATLNVADRGITVKSAGCGSTAVMTGGDRLLER